MTVREKKPYGVARDKVVTGKQTCDRCAKKNPPISECQWPHSKGSTHFYYMDLCQTCVDLMEKHVAKGKTIGPYGELL